MLAKLAEGGIRRTGGKLPLDDLVDAVLAHRDYNLALQPLPGGKRDSQNISGGASSRDDSSRHERQILARLAAAAGQGNSKGSKGGGKNSKGSKGGGKGKNKSSFLPKGLSEMANATAQDEKGNPICFAFNLNGCDLAQPGGTCPKGRHVCVLRGCRKPHSATASHKR